MTISLASPSKRQMTATQLWPLNWRRRLQVTSGALTHPVEDQGSALRHLRQTHGVKDLHRNKTASDQVLLVPSIAQLVRADYTAVTGALVRSDVAIRQNKPTAGQISANRRVEQVNLRSPAGSVRPGQGAKLLLGVRPDRSLKHGKIGLVSPELAARLAMAKLTSAPAKMSARRIFSILDCKVLSARYCVLSSGND